jgi:hypothetical protein
MMMLINKAEFTLITSSSGESKEMKVRRVNRSLHSHQKRRKPSRRITSKKL